MFPREARITNHDITVFQTCPLCEMVSRLLAASHLSMCRLALRSAGWHDAPVGPGVAPADEHLPPVAQILLDYLTPPEQDPAKKEPIRLWK